MINKILIEKFLRKFKVVYMKKPTTPQKLAEDILFRSRCSVQVGAVIADRHGIFSWGWNNEGLGYGRHAEEHAIIRANPSRLRGASIYVSGIRKRNGFSVTARPCDNCMNIIRGVGIKRIYYRDKFNVWKMEVVG